MNATSATQPSARPTNGGARLTRAQADFLRTLLPAAREVAARYALPVSVMLAQAILESDWGRSRLARQALNLFGIKAVNRHADSLTLPTTEYEAGRPRLVPARFAAYTNLEDCLADYARLLAFAPRYAPARAVAHDPFAFAEQLAACGYATDPDYARKLVQLIRRYRLTRFDRLPRQRRGLPAGPARREPRQGRGELA
jgi:flagellum-specific peptidoglycan hydrolase FlgJ